MTNKAQKQRFAAIILAAGKGTRMKSRLPKVMQPLAGKPLISHVVATTTLLGAEKITLVIAPGMEVVKETALKENHHLQFAIQTQQHGTGHAVKYTQKTLGKYKGHVLILYGDTPLLTADVLQTLLNTMDASNKPAIAVLGMRPAEPGHYGRLIVNSKGEVERVVEYKDATTQEKKITLCNAGVVVVRKGLLFPLLRKLTNKNAKKEYYLTDIIAHARKAGHKCAVVEAPAELTLGINSRVELAAAEHIFQQRMRLRAMENGTTLVAPETVFFSTDTVLGTDTIVHPFVTFGPGVHVGNNVTIRSYSHIEGATIGDDVIIGPFARLRPGTKLADSVHIGNFVEIKNSQVANGAKINHLSYVGDATVGRETNIGAGTITCNYDGKRKYRTNIGDEVFIGSNTALVAPVNIGKGAVVSAGSTITKDVEEGDLALARMGQINKTGWVKRYAKKKDKNLF